MSTFREYTDALLDYLYFSWEFRKSSWDEERDEKSKDNLSEIVKQLDQRLEKMDKIVFQHTPIGPLPGGPLNLPEFPTWTKEIATKENEAAMQEMCDSLSREERIREAARKLREKFPHHSNKWLHSIGTNHPTNTVIHLFVENKERAQRLVGDSWMGYELKYTEVPGGFHLC